MLVCAYLYLLGMALLWLKESLTEFWKKELIKTHCNTGLRSKGKKVIILPMSGLRWLSIYFLYIYIASACYPEFVGVCLCTVVIVFMCVCVCSCVFVNLSHMSCNLIGSKWKSRTIRQAVLTLCLPQNNTVQVTDSV